MKFDNKTVVITGTSTGIGRATAIEFAKEGALVILGSRSIEGLKNTKREIDMLGGKGESIEVDLANERSLDSFIDKIKKNYKEINALVNIAGIWHGKNEVYAEKNFETFEKNVIKDTFNVGLIAPALLVYSFIPFMTKGSSIMNLSGTFSSGGKGWIPYYVSKRAIEDLTVGLSEELKNKGIRVNGISPSDVATEAYKKYFP